VATSGSAQALRWVRHCLVALSMYAGQVHPIQSLYAGTSLTFTLYTCSWRYDSK